MKPTAGNNFMNPDFAPRAQFPEQQFGQGAGQGFARFTPPGQTKLAEKNMPLQGLASGALEAFRNFRGRGAGNFMKSIGPQVSNLAQARNMARSRMKQPQFPNPGMPDTAMNQTLNYMNPAPMSPAFGNPQAGGIPAPGGMNPFSAREGLGGFNPNFGNVVSGEMRPQSRDMTKVPKLKFNNPATRMRNQMEQI
jgi:hypothetical protein